VSSAGKHALWLIPEGGDAPIYQELATLIAKLAKHHGTPAFEPHVTLLGGLRAPVEELRAHAKSLAGDLAPFRVRLGHIFHLDEYYRALFVQVAETGEVMDAFSRAREAMAPFLNTAAALELKGVREPMPHLSLLYGELPAALKEGIIKELGSEYPASFTAQSIHIYRTNGDPPDWRRVASFTLRGRPSAAGEDG
jgi:2'-5' RNA ligase